MKNKLFAISLTAALCLSLISFVQYVLPTESYFYDKNFQRNFVLFNGYTVLEGKEFISAHNLTPVKEVDRYGFSIMEELISVGIKTE